MADAITAIRLTQERQTQSTGILALADVAIVVSDARASAKWWVKNLGFSTYTIGGEGGHAVLVAPPGERFVLHLCEDFAPLEPGNSGIAFVTDAIDALVDRMTKAEVKFPEPLKMEKWGKMAKFADPDGNVFWLLEAPTSMVKATLGSRAPVREQVQGNATSKCIGLGQAINHKQAFHFILA